MTIIIVGKWDNILSPIMERRLWENVLRCFGIDKLIMVSETGLGSTEYIDLEEYKDLNSVFAAYPTYKKVFVECPESAPLHTKLRDYVHPKVDVMYIFANTASSNSLLVKTDDCISIETPVELPIIWAFNILATVLYDKMIKG